MKVNSKAFGIYFSILSGLSIMVTLIIGIILLSFALASNISFFMLIPFLVIYSVILVMGMIGIYIGVRYIKGRVEYSSIFLGKIIISLSIFYFVYTLITLILANLMDNSGGWGRLIFAFFLIITGIPLGIVVKNGVKT